MTEEGYIPDVPLPLNQDFNALKDQGLAYIQLHSDYHWTNLNASDPGVTILDQICYALTELGYCNDFPVRDILARKDDKIHIYDQFYLPETILTTSPVSVTDYAKYLIDGVTDVDNAVFLRYSSATNAPPVYNTLLLIDPSVNTNPPTTPAEAWQNPVCTAAFVYLNAARNLCELFTVPLALKPAAYELNGKIEIENKDDLDTIVQLINQSISNYIFPPVIPRSYKQLLAGTETMDTIFDGPRLKNGWISTDMLGTKKDDITIYEIIQLIEVIPGVISVDELHFSESLPGNEHRKVDKVHCGKNEVLVINATLSYNDGQLVFFSNGTTITSATYTLTSTVTQSTPDFESNILFGASIDIRTDLPKATYRDINTYYSIQNTFPDIYPVGPEFIDSNATDFQIAQSRQLMGYLTLFDQVLANQFSQLANVEQLFSFKNAMTATPSDMRWYYAMKDHFQHKPSMYPVPYLRFSPTYYLQALYDVPGIRPVLKGSDAFDYHTRPLSETRAEKIEWKRYRLDPYNPYIRELMNMMEEEEESLLRRNKMLDHLLARHGESPLLINAYINGSVYTNEESKDNVIFKSLYLQNLGLLSYNRYKAYNYLQADPFVQKFREKELTESKSVEELRREFEKWILTDPSQEDNSELAQLITDQGSYYSEYLMKWILVGNTIDSIFDSEKVNGLEKLGPNDVRNYSGIELKFALLFGMHPLYRNLLVTGQEEKTPGTFEPVYSNDVKLQALWLISRRKGFIMIEMSLLFRCMQFDLFFTDASKNQWKIAMPLGYDEASALMEVISHNSKSSSVVQFDSTTSQLTAGGTVYQLMELTPADYPENSYQPLNGTTYDFMLQVNGTNTSFAQVSTLMNGGPLFIFPDYISTFRTYEFYARAKFFLENELPANTQFSLNYAGYDVMENLRNAFIQWHDSLVQDTFNNYSLASSSDAAVALFAQILQTHPLPYPVKK